MVQVVKFRDYGGKVGIIYRDANDCCVLTCCADSTVTGGLLLVSLKYAQRVEDGSWYTYTEMTRNAGTETGRSGSL